MTYDYTFLGTLGATGPSFNAGDLAVYLSAYAKAGAQHIVLRFAGDHERHLETVADLRGKIA